MLVQYRTRGVTLSRALRRGAVEQRPVNRARCALCVVRCTLVHLLLTRGRKRSQSFTKLSSMSTKDQHHKRSAHRPKTAPDSSSNRASSFPKLNGRSKKRPKDLSSLQQAGSVYGDVRKKHSSRYQLPDYETWENSKAAGVHTKLQISQSTNTFFQPSKEKEKDAAAVDASLGMRSSEFIASEYGFAYKRKLYNCKKQKKKMRAMMIKKRWGVALHESKEIKQRRSARKQAVAGPMFITRERQAEASQIIVAVFKKAVAVRGAGLESQRNESMTKIITFGQIMLAKRVAKRARERLQDLKFQGRKLYDEIQAPVGEIEPQPRIPARHEIFSKNRQL